MVAVSGVMLSIMLLAGQEAVGIGSGPKGLGAPPDMPVSTAGDAPGSSSAVSRNPAVLRKVTPQRAQAFRAQVAGRRAAAEASAAAAQAGGSAEQLRSELKTDMEIWRDSFAVTKAEWKANLDQWLPHAAALTAAEWAERRVSWFQSRDAWLAAKQNK
jgi:hypothetical protein